MHLGADLRAMVEGDLWPLVEGFVEAHEVAGLTVAVVRGDEVVSRGWGVRDLRTGEPITDRTMFHLASVSKPFVATAIVSLATPRDGAAPLLDLDAPIAQWAPELTLADGREREVTARGLLSHTSGLPDVSDYGWHDPQLGDDALSEFVRSLSPWRLQSEPGRTFSYSNAGYELLGLALSRVTGTTFEDAMRRKVLDPLGMSASTFLRAEVPEQLAASPHVGSPLTVPEHAYPYTRRHAPSSTLHSNLVEMSDWLQVLLAAAGGGDGGIAHVAGLDPDVLDLMWRPVVEVGEPPWEETMSLGWGVGSYLGHRVLSHSGADPGFGSRFALVPERRTGVVVLANSNTVPASLIVAAALDLVLAEEPSDGVVALGAMLPAVVGPVAETLSTSGPEAAAEMYHRLAAADPAEFDLDDEGFVDAVWGAIELRCTGLVWPLLRLWTSLRPDSSAAWAMTGWAQQVDGDLEGARTRLGRALELDPDNADARLILSNMSPS